MEKLYMYISLCSIEVLLYSENGKFTFLRNPLGDLKLMYVFCLKLIKMFQHTLQVEMSQHFLKRRVTLGQTAMIKGYIYPPYLHIISKVNDFPTTMLLSFYTKSGNRLYGDHFSKGQSIATTSASVNQCQHYRRRLSRNGEARGDGVGSSRTRVADSDEKRSQTCYTGY